MESRLWYSEATLTLGTSRLRAGTLIQCARRWESLGQEDRQRASLRLAAPIDGVSVMEGDEIGTLALRPGYKFA
jgi:hypothetical protein